MAVQREQFQAAKRKQECVINGSAHRNDDQQSIVTKKKCLIGDILNGHSEVHPLLNGHENGINHRFENNVQSQLGNPNDCTTATTDHQTQEIMDCTTDNDIKSLEVNGNDVSSVNLCPHGHANACTTYNVPCRYPRMYCHPAGLLEEHIAAYGF